MNWFIAFTICLFHAHFALVCKVLLQVLRFCLCTLFVHSDLQELLWTRNKLRRRLLQLPLWNHCLHHEELLFITCLVVKTSMYLLQNSIQSPLHPSIASYAMITLSCPIESPLLFYLLPLAPPHPRNEIEL